jgi:ribose transport system permease protein
MSTTPLEPSQGADGSSLAARAVVASRGRRYAAYLSPKRISAVYVLIALIIVFGITQTDTFLTATNLRTLLTQQAVTAILAVGLVIPIAVNAFDFSCAATLGLAGVVAAWLLGLHGYSIPVAIAIALGFGVAVGLLNGILITYFRINSFIATLAMSSVLAAMTVWISGNRDIIGLPAGFQAIATNTIFGIQLPVYFLVVIALVVWFVLEHTTTGRYLYATGGGREAARLAGVNVDRLTFGALLACGVIAAFAGIVACAGLGAGTPSLGAPYLLPALSAVFLGATQFQRGRVNVWGTVLAVYLLATGVKGLQLAGAPLWLPDLFNGLALMLAVGLSVEGRRAILRGRGRRGDQPQSQAGAHA